MPNAAPRVRLEGVDLPAVLPMVRLFESFKMALQPTKLLIALLMILLIYFGGVTLDFMWGEQETPTTANNYSMLDGGAFFLTSEWQHGQYRVFDVLVRSEIAYFDSLVYAAISLNFSGDMPTVDAPNGGVLWALKNMVIGTPRWLWNHHPCFFVIFGIYAAIVKLILGGAIARLAATEACQGVSTGLMHAAGFTVPRAFWLVIAPVMPLFLVGLFWFLIALVGMLLFRIPVLDVLGGFLYGLALIGGFIGAVMLLFTLLGAGLFGSAIAVEGTDAFDAVSRVFSFLIYRPMRYLIYTGVMIFYGAVTYFIVSALLGFGVYFTAQAVGAWSGVRWEEIWDLARQPVHYPDSYQVEVEVGATQNVAAWLVGVWLRLAMALSLAYVTSYFFTAQTWIYLLLRHALDGTDFSEYDDEHALFRAVPVASIEKVEDAADVDNKDAGDAGA